MNSDLLPQILSEYEKHGVLSQTFLMRRFGISAKEAFNWMKKIEDWLVGEDKIDRL